MIARSLLLLLLYLMLLACCTDGCQTKTGEKYEALFLDKIMKGWDLDERFRKYIKEDPRYKNVKNHLFSILKHDLIDRLIKNRCFLLNGRCMPVIEWPNAKNKP